ncbi:MAG: TIM barrel protein [Pseudomonadota bacterium]
MKFSANLGFLWSEHALPDAIRAAKAAGFDAVECHWPYDVPTTETRAALEETGLAMLGLNTNRGNVAAGENGLSAVPGREAVARAAIDQAIAYANAIDAQAIHVMAGKTDAEAAPQTFLDNLAYACDAARNRTILIEPLNAFDAPGYFLRDTTQAVEIIQAVKAPNLKLMFDCYHVARTEGDVLARLMNVFEHVGHIQFAGVPSRGAPDEGELDYPSLFDEIAKLGWNKPLGAEYKPNGPTEDTLNWFKNPKFL